MAHKIDVSKGTMVSSVSEQWANRGPDERFTSLTALRDQVSTWREQSRTRVFDAKSVKILHEGTTGVMAQISDEAPMGMTPYGFDLLSSLAGAPRSYMRKLPSPLVAANLRYGLLTAAQEDNMAYIREDEAGNHHLRAITSPKYGRIYDEDVVKAVMEIAGDGTGDTNWKVPGTIDWTAKHGVTYNPEVDITKDNTTLYASDRDVFMFLVDDKNPIEVGKLENGDPDLMFRGFYVWNSEVGRRTFGLATMYLRGVCQNRCLWGVEGFSEVTFRHTSGAPERFTTEAAPALASFAQGSAKKVIEGVTAAKNAIIATDVIERVDYLQSLDFSKKQAHRLIEICEQEEGHAPTSAWDFSAAISAAARRLDLQEDRLAMEAVAGKILDKIKA